MFEVEAVSSGALLPACFPLVVGRASFESKNFLSLDIFELIALLWLGSSVGAFSEARLLREDFFSLKSFCSPGLSWPCSTSQSSEKKSLLSSLLFAPALLFLVLVCWCDLSFFSM